MERKVGEIFEYNEEWYQCIVQPKGTEGQSCSICSMNFGGKCPIHVIECAMEGRSDGKSVIFKKLEKVGEPFKSMGNCYQVYKTYLEPTNVGLGSSYDGSKVVIKIKQNKENMEEREYSEEDMKNNPRFKHHKNIKQVINMQKMKPFDLEAAKAGKPVCTRDGRKARIICFDAKRKDGKNIMALIPSKEYPGFEDLVAYPNNGNYHGGHENDGDLMMLPEKKEGWVNIYNRNRPRTSSENCYIMTGVSVFETKEGAISYIDKDKEYIDTVKIEWEE